jgi:hypothetical protein
MMPEEHRLPPDVTAEELEYYGIPALYGKHLLMAEDWSIIPEILMGWFPTGYECQVEEKWFRDMQLWVGYHGPNDRWGTLFVCFTDVSRDVEKMFAILKELPEGERLVGKWWEGWEMKPSAEFRRATFWETPNNIWTGSDYGLDRLFWDPEDPNNFWPHNLNDPNTTLYRWEYEPLDSPW